MVYMDNKTLIPYENLALGTRFKFPSSDKTWVKLSSDGTIAEWDTAQQTHRWLGQMIAHIEPEDPDQKFVIVV